MPLKRLLVTGAGGFVGAAVVKAAAAAGHDVVALVRNDASRLRNLARIQIERADLADDAAVSDLLRRTRPDIVVHSAWEGVGGPLRSGDIQLDNIRTTVALTDASIAAGAHKFVGIGSQAEYGGLNRRIVETDLPQPTMLYGAAKLAAMHLASQRCREALVDFSWLRLFSVYGPGDNPNWLIPSVAASLLRGIVPKCTAGTQKWDYLHIDDVAAGVLAAADSDSATGVFNLSSGIPVAVRHIIEQLRDIYAPGLDLTFGKIPFGPDQIMHLEGDNMRLRQATGWQPKVALEDGLRSLHEPRLAAA
ncbi:NAD(P)-dependent oxidoreductase [Sphingomonas piscis]|uniref:NAD(P)-dependent oxidoreductase n=1 Tax=Sphingomonas piscis TaxID=2714943 RepID=A0A6G7YRU7_9SPHN|nr:NAD(P)-dependent oxidoreductase [Sphingomonas piscis]QIK79463.1 NAD(P)-dependent oxidoreductase [Sphingomonas piscis]